jgi:hypothetical protein
MIGAGIVMLSICACEGTLRSVLSEDVELLGRQPCAPLVFVTFEALICS